MSGKYVYFAPTGGFVDLLARINIWRRFCRSQKRTLLLDTSKTMYRINFHQYFNISGPVITDTALIDKIVENPSLTRFPTNFDFDKLKKNKYIFTSLDKKRYFRVGEEGVKSLMPKEPWEVKNYSQDIIVSVTNGGGVSNACKTLESLSFKKDFGEEIRNEYIEKKNLVGSDYLCLHVRHTDYSNDYKSFYIKHKKKIHSYSRIYLCTDNPEVIDFFVSKKLNVYNFTTFPDGTKHIENVDFYKCKKPKALPLHHSNIDGHRQLKDLLIDMSFAADSAEFLPAGGLTGGYVQLCDYYKKKSDCSVIDFLHESK